MKLPIYLDYHATTPVDPRVLEAMLPFFTETFGNPASRNHKFGWTAATAVENARKQMAKLINARAKEIVFTSGASESDNLAIKGVAHRYRDRGDHIITLATEHKAVLDSAKRLAQEGFRVTYARLQPDGLVDLENLKQAITEKTLLVSVMAANNEIGVLQPLEEIGRLCHERGALFHTDAAQGVGKIALDVAAMGIDLMSVSGHKIYGPKGVGALYVRRRPRVRLTPLFSGGGQEHGLRSGTLPVPLIVGLGEAARLAQADMAAEAPRLAALRDRLLERLQYLVPGVVVNGSPTARIAGNLNVTFPAATAAALMAAVPELCVSTGSACSSAELEPSYVLRALGLSDAEAGRTLRIGIGRFTSPADIEFAATALAAAHTRIEA